MPESGTSNSTLRFESEVGHEARHILPLPTNSNQTLFINSTSKSDPLHQQLINVMAFRMESYPLRKEELERLLITTEQIHLGIVLLKDKMISAQLSITKRGWSHSTYELHQRQDSEDDLQLLRIILSHIETTLIVYAPTSPSGLRY